MGLTPPLKCKNLRAAHITAIAAIVKAGVEAGAHSASSITVGSYLDPDVLAVFDMEEYFGAKQIEASTTHRGKTARKTVTLSVVAE